MTKWILIFLFPAFLTSCLQSGDALDDVTVPSVEIQCDQFQVPQCRSSDSTGKTVYLGLLNYSTDCVTYVGGIPAGQFQTYFNASSTGTAAFVVTYATATFTSFKNSTGASLTALSDGIYTACSFIDIDGNGKLDFYEPVASGLVDISESSNPAVTDWVQY